MAELLQKLRESAIRYGKLASKKIGEAWTSFRAKSVSWKDSATRYLKEKNIPEKVEKCREKASCWSANLLEKSRVCREKASQWGAKAWKKTRETWTLVKGKTAEAEASTQKFLAEKNIPEKVQKAKDKARNAYDASKPKCSAAWAWVVAKTGLLTAWAKKFYEEKISKYIPNNGISQEETDKVWRFTPDDKGSAT